MIKSIIKKIKTIYTVIQQYKEKKSIDYKNNLLREEDKMASAFDIANWFISYKNNNIQPADNDGYGQISKIKLQKLLYYAQGMSLSILGQPLFEDPIVAWEDGPVVACVWQKYKNIEGHFIPQAAEDKPNLTDTIEILLESVFSSFARFTRWDLINMTHDETPWRSTKKNQIISQDKLKSYFLSSHWEEKQMVEKTLNINKLNMIKNLPNNWDGEGAEKISEKLVNRVIDIISIFSPQPHIVPTRRKSIQLEFGTVINEKYLEIELFDDKDTRIGLVKNYNEFQEINGIRDEDLVRFVNEV